MRPPSGPPYLFAISRLGHMLARGGSLGDFLEETVRLAAACAAAPCSLLLQWVPSQGAFTVPAGHGWPEPVADRDLARPVPAHATDALNSRTPGGLLRRDLARRQRRACAAVGPRAASGGRRRDWPTAIAALRRPGGIQPGCDGVLGRDAPACWTRSRRWPGPRSITSSRPPSWTASAIERIPARLAGGRQRRCHRERHARGRDPGLEPRRGAAVRLRRRTRSSAGTSRC